MRTVIRDLVFGTHGQGMTEYGLILGVFLVAAAGALAFVGLKVLALYTEAKEAF